MNTEPPQGDDLQQMLVTMKQNVLARAEADRPAPRRRGRRAGIVIGVIAVLGIGATSGAVALGMVPQPFTAAPAPSPTTTEPPETPTKSSAPVVNEPTATPTPTRRPYDVVDPSTWTISGNEIGPVALGGPTAGETDDLAPAYVHVPSDDVCSDGIGSGWERDDGSNVVVWSREGVVIGVTVWLDPDAATNAPLGPTTAEGIGIGSTLDDIRSTYADAVRDAERSADVVPEPTQWGYTSWKVLTATGPVFFGLDADGVHVRSVDIGSISQASCD